MFSKILIANRGEIAVRIIRACNEMGISTVAVYSEADANSLHVNLADESYCIGPALLKDSYLNMTAIIDVAIATGCQAIHPGYGLLSENARFAELCEKCNVKFIGPHYSVIAKMGDKDEARRTMKAAGVPVVPGLDEIADVAEAKAFAAKIGYPVIVKASAGGGGRGIRIVEREEDFETAVALASNEALSAFGNGKVYLEKFLTDVKHVEMQIVADEQGNVVCLGERDCSMQRKNQKLIEESPCVVLKEDVRREMMRCAVLAAKAVNYTSLGTIEFLLDKNNDFYFMEMNTRLQVEHPVTEYVTGIDIVKWQIRIAAGVEFMYKQEDIRFRGCAIECRINAEDVRKNFRPCCGRINLLHIPGGPWVRFDTAIYQDYMIPPYYDSMIGKLIVFARDRTEAIRKMQAALCELVIEGVCTNAELSGDILAEPAFKSGEYCTNFLDKFLKNY
ncbi:acetyl-CoA carboxylase biotin carboxylase subunit [Candidatus Borkfalkia ceftriaxoniphila]|uniref:Biotin carboxylase n=1 Tax=Candidatus Borkfalkia ceftriaxoniphila TaxID=2508949 RepID=A0A4Q2KA96_9FIRM|nr:acetyl-CoA carboxylase biotin carboxylase subunit [Candidatus Borkfalkia ceftriaxoniphila]RXZ61475.1 acetyl-CoA carboxylase biotin carboxylase subunit [Candidatus Borkfalkia ceftriaxoniphila]